MASMNVLVIDLFVKANARYARGSNALLHGSQALSKHLRDAIQKCRSGAPSGGSQWAALIEPRAHSPLDALVNVATIAAARDGYNDRLTPCLAMGEMDARVDEAATCQTHGCFPSTSNGGINQKTPQPQWNEYGRQGGSQQAIEHQVPYVSTSSVPLSGQNVDSEDDALRTATERSASASNGQGQVLHIPQSWEDSNQTGMMMQPNSSDWVGYENGSLNFAGHEGWLDLMNFPST